MSSKRNEDNTKGRLGRKEKQLLERLDVSNYFGVYRLLGLGIPLTIKDCNLLITLDCLLKLLEEQTKAKQSKNKFWF